MLTHTTVILGELACLVNRQAKPCPLHLLFANRKRALGFTNSVLRGPVRELASGVRFLSCFKMVKRKVKQIKLRDIFSEWREVEEGDQGFALAVLSGKIRIEVIKKVNANYSDRVIFLGEIIKPTMCVGFLNAFLMDCRGDLKNLREVSVPVFSKLKVKKIEEYFALAEGLKAKAVKLEGLVKLKLGEV